MFLPYENFTKHVKNHNLHESGMLFLSKESLLTCRKTLLALNTIFHTALGHSIPTCLVIKVVVVVESSSCLYTAYLTFGLSQLNIQILILLLW